MNEIKEFTRGSINPKHLIDTVDYKINFLRNNPDYFEPSGIWVFEGPQGCGKTISMVQCLKEMCKTYPKALVCTNLEIKGIENDVIPFTEYNQLIELTNGIKGIIFALDEIHVLWNSLESKDIPISEMACFCQMRKDRRVILGTSQVYSRIAKPIREQLQYVIHCHNLFNMIQINTIIDPSNSTEQNGHISGEIVGRSIWFHRPDLYKSYDTLFKIVKADRKEDRKEIRKYVRFGN